MTTRTLVSASGSRRRLKAPSSDARVQLCTLLKVIHRPLARRLAFNHHSTLSRKFELNCLNSQLLGSEPALQRCATRGIRKVDKPGGLLHTRRLNGRATGALRWARTGPRAKTQNGAHFGSDEALPHLSAEMRVEHHCARLEWSCVIDELDSSTRAAQHIFNIQEPVDVPLDYKLSKAMDIARATLSRIAARAAIYDGGVK